MTYCIQNTCTLKDEKLHVVAVIYSMHTEDTGIREVCLQCLTTNKRHCKMRSLFRVCDYIYIVQKALKGTMSCKYMLQCVTTNEIHCKMGILFTVCDYTYTDTLRKTLKDKCFTVCYYKKTLKDEQFVYNIMCDYI